MINEPLFQQLLDNRAKIQNKGRKINTEKAVKMLRTKLDGFEIEGYDTDYLINRSLEYGWLSVFRHGEPKQKHLTAHKAVSEATDSLLRSTRMPRAKNKYKQAEAAKKLGRDALENLRRITRSE